MHVITIIIIVTNRYTANGPNLYTELKGNISCEYYRTRIDDPRILMFLALR